MKKLFTLTLILCSLNGFAQKAERLTYAALPVDSTTHLVTYSSVVPVAGATKEQLYLRAREWAARSFSDSKSAVRMDDKESGTYIARGTIRLSSDQYYTLMLAIYTKNGKYRYVVDQLAYTYAPSNTSLVGLHDEAVERWAGYTGFNARYADRRIHELQVIIPKLVTDLQTAMSDKAGGLNKDW